MLGKPFIKNFASIDLFAVKKAGPFLDFLIYLLLYKTV